MPVDTLTEFRHSFDLDPAATQRRFTALQDQAMPPDAGVATLTAAVTPPTPAASRRSPPACGCSPERTSAPRQPDPQPVRLLHGGEDKLMPSPPPNGWPTTCPTAGCRSSSTTGHALRLAPGRTAPPLIERLHP